MTSHTVPASHASSRAAQFISKMGRRNVAYVACTLVLFALAQLLEQFAHGQDRGAGVLAGMMLWMIGSAMFFGINALLILGGIIGQVMGRPSRAASPMSHAVIGCTLPLVVLLIGGMVS